MHPAAAMRWLVVTEAASRFRRQSNDVNGGSDLSENQGKKMIGAMSEKMIGAISKKMIGVSSEMS